MANDGDYPDKPVLEAVAAVLGPFARAAAAISHNGPPRTVKLPACLSREGEKDVIALLSAILQLR